MKWVLELDKENKFKYWLYNFMIVFGDMLMIFPAILMGKMVDEGITGGNKEIILPLAMTTIVIVVVGTLLAYFGVVLIDSWGFRLAKKLRIKMYEKLNSLDSSFYNEIPLGEITTIFSDSYQIRLNMCFTVKTVLAALLRFFGALIYCFIISSKLTLIIMIPLPILFYFSNKYIKTSKKNYNDKREYLSVFNNFIQENIDSNRLVKNYGTEKEEIKKFKNKNRVLKNKNLNIKYKFINYNITTIGLNELICALLIFFGFLFVMNGEITIGQWLVFDSLLWCLKTPFENASTLLDNWQNFGVALKKMKWILSQEPKILDGTLELKGKRHEIEFKNVWLKYDETFVLKNFNMHIMPGKTYALIGSIGSGKSTVARLLLRLEDVSKGEILIDGKNIKEYKLSSLRENIGYVSQTAFLFSDTIKNNVNFGNLNLSDEEIEKYIRLSKADFVYKLKNGINEVIGEGGVDLSGGEKQRLSLARALAKNPNMLILDDITSALDFETELEVTKNINDLRYDCTKLIIAQKILSVKDADEIFVLEKGKVKEQGTHQSLIKKNGLYKELYDIQKRGIKL